MPEYLAPAVYIEETSFRAKSIEGVGTSTTGFVGPTRKGPGAGPPELITSFGNFEQVYGGFGNLRLGARNVTNYIAHAVKNFFDNGGSRLFVARVYSGAGGISRSDRVGGDADNNSIRFVARTPGAVNDGIVTTGLVTKEVTATLGNTRALDRAPEGTMLANGDAVFVKTNDVWDADGDADNLDLTADGFALDANAGFVTLNVLFRDAEENETFYEDLGLAPGHPRYVGDVLAQTPSRRIDDLENPINIAIAAALTPFQVHTILATVAARRIELTGGTDGALPNAGAYDAPLLDLQRNEDISIIAAPGSSDYADGPAIADRLITHAEQRRAYRIAVLDAPRDASGQQAVAFKSRIDSTMSALYHPWVMASNPLARPDDLTAPREVMLPPSGFVCGIYARNDNSKGVAKSPANEIVRGALRFQQEIGFAEQEMLNPRGVNCLRYFPGRGNRVWGARTCSSDPEWKYIGPRRYFLYLEHSIDRSTQWAVFENNGPQLWANIRETVSSFLYNEWRNNALLGANPEEAFFVRCDRTTMTQNDLDNGRLVCLIGVSVLKPAEFVIFRIGQKTADTRD